MHASADGSGLDLGRDVRDLVIAEGLVDEHLVGRRAGVGVTGQVLGVPVRLAAVPEHLDDADGEDMIRRVRVGGVEDRLVRVPVGAALEQGAVVHRRDADRGAGPVLGHGRGGPAHDPALAVAVEEQLSGVDDRHAL